MHVLRSSFNAGEISPLMDARVDSEKYGFGCRKLENFLPKVYGGAFRRPGSIFIGAAADETAGVRMFSLNVSATTRYVLELGDEYCRVWNSDGTPFIDKVNAPYSLPLEMVTPYAAADLFEVQMAQVGNVCYFTHPDYPPQRLVRSSNATFLDANGNAELVFTWTAVDWSFPAFRDTNQTAITATPSANTGTITITFAGNPFREVAAYDLYTGARIMLAQRRAASHVKMDLTATADSSAVVVLGDYSVYTYGSYTGTLNVQAKDANGDFQTLRSFQATSDRQILYTSFTEVATELRLSYTHTSGTGATAYLEAADSRRVGYARIVDTGEGIPSFPTGGIDISGGATNPVVSCEVEEDFDSTLETTEWAIEAWGTYAGYPRSVAFHEQRLWFGGTELQPNTFWASQTNDFENFRRGAYDTDALAFTLAAQEGSAIQSLLSHEALVIFTQSEEWTATTSQQTVITPSNIYVRRQSRFGSDHRQSFVANNNILFLQRGGRKLREFRYSPTGADGQSSDLTMLAEHISLTGIRQMAFQQQPDPVIWCVLNGGNLIALTYESDQNVTAWSRHVTSGTVESVAVIYGASGAADEVWMLVKRGERRLIERLDPDAFSRLETDDADGMVYSDSAVVAVNDTPQTIVNGLGHLEGSTVTILADGGVLPNQVVAGGQITLDEAATTIVVGLPFTSTLQPSKVEIGLQDGTAQGRTFLCKKVALNLWKTFGLEYSDSLTAAENEWYPATLRPTDTVMNEPSPLFTGIAEVNNAGKHSVSVDFTLRQVAPLPANILAMIPQVNVTG